MAKEKITYTKQGYEELVNELKRRETVDREKIKNDIAVARGFGDLSENSEYDEARNAQTVNETRILELKELIENAIVLDNEDIDASVISLGSKIRVLDVAENEEIRYELVSSNQASPFDGKISDQCPVGIALIGKKVGDEATVMTNSGSFVLRVLEVGR